MAGVRLYLTPLILVLWAFLWAVGLRGDMVIVLSLTITAGAHVVAELERARRRRESRRP